MSDFEVVDVFKHKTRTCVVVKVTLGISLMEEYHNGYVSLRPSHNGLDYSDYVIDIETDELTYSGPLHGYNHPDIPEDLWFFGFDSAHYWNTRKPHSQTFMSVKERTIDLAKELLKKGI